MATITRSFENLITDVLMSGVSITGSFDSDFVDLSTFEAAHCIINASGNGTTDNLDIEIYGTVNAGATYSNVPYTSFQIETTGGSTKQVDFIVDGLAGFNVIGRSTGSTDTITTTLQYRRWTWTSS